MLSAATSMLGSALEYLTSSEEAEQQRLQQQAAVTQEKGQEAEGRKVGEEKGTVAAEDEIADGPLHAKAMASPVGGGAAKRGMMARGGGTTQREEKGLPALLALPTEGMAGSPTSPWEEKYEEFRKKQKGGKETGFSRAAAVARLTPLPLEPEGADPLLEEEDEDDEDEGVYAVSSLRGEMWLERAKGKKGPALVSPEGHDEEEEEEEEEEEGRLMAAMSPKTLATYARDRSVRFSSLASQRDAVSGAAAVVPLTPHSSFAEDGKEEVRVGAWAFGEEEGDEGKKGRKTRARRAVVTPDAELAAQAEKEAKHVEVLIIAVLLVYLPLYAVVKGLLWLGGWTWRLLVLVVAGLAWRLQKVAGESDLAEKAAEYQRVWAEARAARKQPSQQRPSQSQRASTAFIPPFRPRARTTPSPPAARGPQAHNNTTTATTPPMKGPFDGRGRPFPAPNPAHWEHGSRGGGSVRASSPPSSNANRIGAAPSVRALRRRVYGDHPGASPGSAARAGPPPMTTMQQQQQQQQQQALPPSPFYGAGAGASPPKAKNGGGFLMALLKEKRQAKNKTGGLLTTPPLSGGVFGLGSEGKEEEEDDDDTSEEEDDQPQSQGSGRGRRTLTARLLKGTRWEHLDWR